MNACLQVRWHDKFVKHSPPRIAKVDGANASLARSTDQGRDRDSSAVLTYRSGPPSWCVGGCLNGMALLQDWYGCIQAASQVAGAVGLEQSDIFRLERRRRLGITVALFMQDIAPPC